MKFSTDTHGTCGLLPHRDDIDVWAQADSFFQVHDELENAFRRGLDIDRSAEAYHHGYRIEIWTTYVATATKGGQSTFTANIRTI